VLALVSHGQHELATASQGPFVIGCRAGIPKTGGFA